MKQLLVDVALPVPLHQSFTYIVPPDIAALVRPGSRVLVPFGKKTISGIVVGFPAGSTVKSLRPIHDVLDAAPALSDELLKLGTWMAEYYAAPLGETLKAFLPHGISIENKRTVSLKYLPDPDQLSRLEKSAPQRCKIIRALTTGKNLSIAQLQRKAEVKGLYGILSELSDKGIIEVSERLPSATAKPKFEKYILKKSIPYDFAPKGKLQQKIATRIAQLPTEPYPLQALLKESGASLSSLSIFVKKNFVEVIQREVERTVEFPPDEGATAVSSLQLTQHQSRALKEIVGALQANLSRTFLLHGITGSGKTQVYIEAISAVLAQGKTAIVLVPEISLTPQIVRRFRMHFGNEVAVMHSRMSEGERFDAWRFSRQGKYRIVIGPRSAIFAPLVHLGLVVVDEEHESSYKQFDAAPRYNARDVAIMRGHLANAVVVLGSATPSIESYYNAETRKYSLLELPGRIDNAVLPSITIVNMGDEHKRRFAAMKERAKTIGKKAFEGGFHSISKLLEEKIQDRLRKKEGIILLQNRRGFAPFIECLECGHVERCAQCDVTLTYHLVKKHLRCHYCGSVKPVPNVCAQCKGVQLKLQGFGTQRVEQDVAMLFPDAKVLRMDLDTTTRKGAHDKLLQQFGRGDADILLGTQMVAKGLDFPRVTLVGVISADTQMLLPDFRSAERTFQLLTQVAGRAGRSTLKGEVVIQSYQTDHYSLKHVLIHDYQGFYEEELRYRQSALYTPFARLVLIEFRGLVEKDIRSLAEKFSTTLKRLIPQAVILGPVAAVISKIKNNYRWQVIVKALKTNDPGGALVRNAITRVVQHYSSSSLLRNDARIIVDVDPQGTM
jgi:primosomal protein N' (replication factor Y)